MSKTDGFQPAQAGISTSRNLHLISSGAHTYCIYNPFLETEAEISKTVSINKILF